MSILDEQIVQCEKCGKEITEFESKIRNDKIMCIDCCSEDLDKSLVEVDNFLNKGADNDDNDE